MHSIAPAANPLSAANRSAVSRRRWEMGELVPFGQNDQPLEPLRPDPPEQRGEPRREVDRHLMERQLPHAFGAELQDRDRQRLERLPQARFDEVGDEQQIEFAQPLRVAQVLPRKQPHLAVELAELFQHHPPQGSGGEVERGGIEMRVGEPDQERLPPPVADERAAAGNPPDPPLPGQPVERPVGGQVADAVPAGKLPRRGQPRPRRISAAFNGVLEFPGQIAIFHGTGPSVSGGRSVFRFRAA